MQAIAEVVGTERYLAGTRTFLDDPQASTWLQPRYSAGFLEKFSGPSNICLPRIGNPRHGWAAALSLPVRLQNSWRTR